MCVCIYIYIYVCVCVCTTCLCTHVEHMIDILEHHARHCMLQCILLHWAVLHLCGSAEEVVMMGYADQDQRVTGFLAGEECWSA